ncbi:MAG TPA: hypothetical protein VF017_02845 [Thermoanaerobaculia bacterium]|nr:hypothetical protein [Thermoanaerobaculia bacterium]
MKKVILGGVLVVLVAALVMVAKIGPRNVIGMLLYDQRREGDLVVGDLAPDVVLTALDGQTQVGLASRLGGKPLVLIFGSFT